MATFTYNRDIPFADNDPSDDQPLMQTNTNSTDDLIDVDHYSFETSNLDGWHRQCTFPARNVAAAQTDPASVVYTNADAGSASLNSNLWYRNADGIFPVSAVRAAGYFVGSSNSSGPFPINLTLLNGYNIVAMGVNKTASNTYEIELTANAVTGDNVIVVTGQSLQGQSLTWSFSNPILTISSGSTIGATNVSFVVLQI